MLVKIDHKKCLSNGQCAAVAFPTFVLSATGELSVTTTGEKNTDSELEHAARLCPTGAITLEVSEKQHIIKEGHGS